MSEIRAKAESIVRAAFKDLRISELKIWRSISNLRCIRIERKLFRRFAHRCRNIIERNQLEKSELQPVIANVRYLDSFVPI
jgi:hypothetical protein